MKQVLLLSWFVAVCIFSFGQKSKIQEKSNVLILGHSYEIHSVVLSENRVLNIFLPDTYKASDTARFPVVYLLDGGMDEDFIHITGLYQFNSFPWINRVTPSIIVGIVNTDRKRDMTFPTMDSSDLRRNPTAGHSENFIRFIEKELKPFIKSTFRTNHSETLIGESLGGLLATQILFTKPDLFTDYIIVSPSLWWNNGSFLKQSTVALQNLHRYTRVYFGVGKEGLTPNNPPSVMEVDVNLAADRVKQLNNKNIQLYFDYLPHENHATVMHQAVYNALHFFSLSNNQSK